MGNSDLTGLAKNRSAAIKIVVAWIAIQCLVVFTAFGDPVSFWQQRSPLPQGYDFLDLAAGNGVFVGVGFGPMNTTTNGINWELQSPASPMWHVSFGNGLGSGC